MSERSETKPPADEGRLDRRVRPAAWMDAYGACIPEAMRARMLADGGASQRTAELYGAPLYALTDDEVRILNKAKSDAAWRARRLDLCKCDRIEYCHHCYPPEFREGGEWHGA